MFSTQEFLLTPPSVKVSLALEPIYNALNSLILVGLAGERSGLGEWAEHTSRLLTATERQHNHLVGTMFYALLPDQDHDSFPAFIDELRQRPAETLRDRYLSDITSGRQALKRGLTATPAQLLADRSAFVAHIHALFDDRQPDEYHQEHFDWVHSLLNQPEELKTLVLDHMQSMWERFIQAEWERVLPLLRESLASFEQIDLSDLTALEAVRAITGRDLSSMWDRDYETPEYVFVPSAHMGPYISAFTRGDVTYVLFGARTPEGVRPASSELTRSDLLVQLNALADETRLTILELLTRYKELCAQDIISMLNLSQSSASRHLRQLTASGYLVERRRDVAKCYSLNRGRIQETALALNVFLSTR